MRIAGGRVESDTDGFRMVFDCVAGGGAPNPPRCFQGSTMYGCNMTIDNVVALSSLLLFALLTVLNH